MFALCSLSSAHAEAQRREPFRIDRFRSAPSPDDALTTPLPSTLGHLRPAFGVVGGYAYAPLRARLGEEQQDLVPHRIQLELLGAFGITDRVEVHVRVPMALTATDGPALGITPPDTFSMGDGAVGASVRFLGEGDEQGFWLGAMAEIAFPFGTAEGLASDLDVTARGLLTASIGLPVMRVVLAAGGAYRPARDFETALSGAEIDFALGFLFPIGDSFVITSELVGAFVLRDDPQFGAGTPRGTPLELIFGGRLNTDIGVTGMLGLGFGLTSAPGVPVARVMLGVGWTTPPAPPGDADGDGILDEDDECPDQAEDVDRWQDGDGCPDEDNDEDGLLDAVDACPSQSEDFDGWSDTDGCPDEDDDGDGLSGADDGCPFMPGPEWTRGCPQTLRVEGTRIEFNSELVFVPDTHELGEPSRGTLDELIAILMVDTHMRIRVVASGPAEATSGRRRGRAAPASSDAGAERADAVVGWLVSHGVEPSRVEGVGAPSQGAGHVYIEVLARTGAPGEAP